MWVPLLAAPLQDADLLPVVLLVPCVFGFGLPWVLLLAALQHDPALSWVLLLSWLQDSGLMWMPPLAAPLYASGLTRVLSAAAQLQSVHHCFGPLGCATSALTESLSQVVLCWPHLWGGSPHQASQSHSLPFPLLSLSWWTVHLDEESLRLLISSQQPACVHWHSPPGQQPAQAPHP